MVTIELIERLLYEGESDSLDFKQAQYPFAGESDEKKSELLKDVLALANSWRRADGYILIGIREVKGSVAEVLGITEHIDDAQLQQFVNAKLQRPLRFAYSEVSVAGKSVGILHIPEQERPFFLNDNFGKLVADTVYVRRGSSTAIARPDEVARMGRSPGDSEDVVLDVFFYDPTTRNRATPTVDGRMLHLPPDKEIPDYKIDTGRYPFAPSMRRAIPSYYRDLARFTKSTQLLRPVWFAISNSGNSTAHDVRIEIVVAGVSDGVVLMDEYDYPSAPRKEEDMLSISLPQRFTPSEPKEARVDRVGDEWIVSARAEKVQPKAIVWFFGAIHIGAKSSCNLALRVRVFADNLRSPHQQTLIVPIATQEEHATLQRVIELEDERFRNSPAHRKFLEDHGFTDTQDADERAT